MTRPIQKHTLYILSLVIGLGCTQVESLRVKQLEKSLTDAQQKLTEIEAAIQKVPETNQGLLLKLNHDKQLAISRLERVKENLIAIAPDKVPKDESTEKKSGGH